MSKRHRQDSGLPARGAALSQRRFLVSFDVDCGELVAGHRFVARGLSDVGRIEPSGLGIGEPIRTIQGFDFEYELVPGVPPQADPHDLFQYLVGIAYRCDVALPWEPSDGGAVAPFEGGAATHGSRGDWPLPEGARVLTFTLYGIEKDRGFPSEEPAGYVTVDLKDGTATWTAA